MSLAAGLQADEPRRRGRGARARPPLHPRRSLSGPLRSRIMIVSGRGSMLVRARLLVAVVVAVVVAVALIGAVCSRDARASSSSAQLPAAVRKIMDKKRYDHSSWSLLVADAESGEV